MERMQKAIVNFDKVDESNYVVYDELLLCKRLITERMNNAVTFKRANYLYRQFNSAFDQWLIPELGLFRLFNSNEISLGRLMSQLEVLGVSRKRLRAGG